MIRILSKYLYAVIVDSFDIILYLSILLYIQRYFD